MRIADKIAIVTGAGSGIGRAIAQRLAREGAPVVVDDVDELGGRETVSLIEGDGGRAAFVRADVASEEDARRMVVFAEKMYGGLDILVNNAGCTLPTPSFPDATIEGWTRIIDVYLRGTMLCTQAALGAMRRRGGGAIVNIASGAGVGLAAHWQPEYAAAKAGVIRLTSALASLKDRDNIRVNCICPGWVNTPLSQRSIAALPADRRRRVLRGRRRTVLLEPEEIADASFRLIRDERLAGRVLLYYEGQRPRLVPVRRGA